MVRHRGRVNNMSRILIYISINKSAEYDIFEPTDYSLLKEHVSTLYGGFCPNLGNRLWFQGIISEISDGINDISYWSNSLTVEMINENYDMIVAPMANVFSPYFVKGIELFTKRLKGVKVPIYVIACGVQIDAGSTMNDLINRIGNPASEMISTVYESGGEFALRGYTTKEFFDRLGFSSAVVTGCPSMYQLGRISPLLGIDKNVLEKDFKVALNGKLSEQLYYLHRYPNSEFFDQETYFKILHDSSFFEDKAPCVERCIRSYGYEESLLISARRVNLIADMTAWKNYLQKNRFTMSYGSRIHGSILPILSGIPAVLYAKEERTSEIADYFNIPVITDEKKRIDLYHIYMEADWTRFNAEFSRHYDDYEAFLIKCGIVKKMNTNNLLFNNPEVIDYNPVNEEKLIEIHGKMQNNKYYYKGYELFIKSARRIFRN